MKRRLRIRAALEVICAVVIGVVSHGCQTTEGLRLTTAEKMAWSTYPIATSKGLGACVIVNRADPGAPNHIAPVLITCAHVLAAAPRGPYFLVLRLPQPGANPAVLVLSIDVAPGCNHPYAKHPQYDIAAMQIDVPPEVANVVQIRSFLSEDALARHGLPRVGDPVLVLGFPKVFPGTEGAFPVFRGGTIASYAPGPESENEKYLVHTNVYSGDSGGPVFAAGNHGAPKLLGLVSERIGPKTGEVPLAVAVDANVIRETLALLPQKLSPGNTTSAANRFASTAGSGATVKLVGPPSLLKKMIRARLHTLGTIGASKEKH